MVYRFGTFTFDHDIRQLFRGSTEVHLSPKAFELLNLLLANRSRAISKQELQEHLWPSTFVEETNLAGLVAEIRRALDDSTSPPAFVRTVHGFGYRFAGHVSVDAAALPRAHGGMLCLVVEGRTIVLLEGANLLGREPDATIQIDARGVSRHHARILVAQGAATLEDLRSKNGTQINGQNVEVPTPLRDGDEIGLGTARVTFRVATKSSTTETLSIEDR